ncbi:hypothetical protein APHMUC_1064 [Anaplasma phagocytophilum str. ApMUC09]|uniref:Uncharacterized protein n=1 Tax=Anaplasma phagocytophilum str. ApMUC09 TaxID=1359152 RepID=A0A0F3N9P5_ANAPH|nr:hypothetical protein APHMUC_1064 [Anaplasma phagocytophilum str. ApMUC09]
MKGNGSAAHASYTQENKWFKTHVLYTVPAKHLQGCVLLVFSVVIGLRKRTRSLGYKCL